MVNSTGSSSNLTDLMQQAVNAIGSYRTDLQNQLPAPVSSLTQLKGVNNLDTALTAQVCWLSFTAGYPSFYNCRVLIWAIIVL